MIAISTAPVKKGRVRLMDSNMYPARVGAMVLTPILAELLMPIAVAVSSGDTIPDAKVCLMGIVKRTIILFKTISETANGYQLERANSTVTPADIILVATMVCLAVAAVIFVAIAKTAATCRRLGEVQTWQAQAAWLAESAVERAAARLAADAGYAGETWALSPAELGGADGAVVAISVEPIPEKPGRRAVRCRADYPNHPHHRCREVRQVVVQLSE